MKRALTVVLFRLFTIGVCVDGYEVSVTEGDSVTLKSGVTELKTDDEIEWMFSGSPIATISRGDSGISVKVEPNVSFRDRLQLDRQTGDLKISNISTTDSGEYKPTISSPSGSPPEVTFTVKVVSAYDVKLVSVLEGDSVTLPTGLTEIQRDDVIQWRYGQQKSPVAEIIRDAGIFNTYDGPDGRFRDRLKLDRKTGSLIITNIKTTDSGLYEVEISRTSSRHTIHHTQSFNVTVSNAVKSLSVKKGESVTLPITEIKNDDLIWWIFEDIDLAEINKTAKRFFIYYGPDERFRDRLKLDHQTGSLTITDTRTTDSGLYQVKIISSRYIINSICTVSVSAVPGPRLSSAVPDPRLSSAVPDPRLSSDGPDPGLSPGAVAGIGVVGGFLLGAAAAAGVFYYRYKRSKALDNVDPETKEKGYDSS